MPHKYVVIKLKLQMYRKTNLPIKIDDCDIISNVCFVGVVGGVGEWREEQTILPSCRSGLAWKGFCQRCASQPATNLIYKQSFRDGSAPKRTSRYSLLAVALTCVL